MVCFDVSIVNGSLIDLSFLEHVITDETRRGGFSIGLVRRPKNPSYPSALLSFLLLLLLLRLDNLLHNLSLLDKECPENTASGMD